MKRFFALFLTLIPLTCSAETISQPIDGSPGEFLVKAIPAFTAFSNVPDMHYAPQGLASTSLTSCPNGYDILKQSVRNIEGKGVLIWEIRCITPATPEAKVPAEK